MEVISVTVKYYDLMKKKPEWFRNLPNGIEILTDENEIASVEREYNTTIGVIYDDEYVIILKDAVRFPDGTKGPYIRTYHKHEGSVSILTIYKEKILLMKHFRHSLRDWLWETPRGFGEQNQSPLENATRELIEEIGSSPEKIRFLGQIVPDAGIVGQKITLYLAQIPTNSNIVTELHEGIQTFRLFTKNELKRAIASGEIIDGITIASIALAEYKGYF